MKMLAMVFAVCAPLFFAGCVSHRGAAVEVQETDNGAVQSAPQTVNPTARPIPQSGDDLPPR